MFGSVPRGLSYTVWVNNVGRGVSRLPSELTDEDIDLMMSVNVKSALYGMQAAARHFTEQGRGHVINVSSKLGRVPHVVERSAYSASKHFLNSLTANFRDEVTSCHPEVVFSLVSPGLVYTDFGINALHGGIDSKALRSTHAGQEEDEVARVIVDTMVTRKVDVYTQPGSKQDIREYLDTLTSDP